MTPEEIVKRLRNRTELINYGHGDVRDIPDEDCNAAADLIEQQAKALEEAEKALEELISDQEISVRWEYGWPDVHPAMQKRFDRDMASVNDAKTVLAAIRALKST